MKHSVHCLVALVGLLFSVNLLAGSIELERLFTTAEQRAIIDRDHLAFKKQISTRGSSSVSVQHANRSLFFEALLRTEAGYSIWLNGSMIEGVKVVHGILLNTKKISAGNLILNTPNGIRKLGLGQVYWVDQDKITESYEQP
ncbi:MAG: hypothetical protein B7Y68_03310 [Thiotrichales bacterium 35-46-9]|nr:MAG: hypothetical protein B7Y68_03310 [Thiotrichales bacterium 35-46-9]